MKFFLEMANLDEIRDAVQMWTLLTPPTYP